MEKRKYSSWMDMTFGTYCAIQNVLDNKNSEKYSELHVCSGF